MTIFIASVPAPEIVAFMAGNLAAIAGLSALNRWRDIRATLAARQLLVAMGAIWIFQMAFVALRSDVIDPWRWFAMGFGAGVSIFLIDWGMSCGRWWLLRAVTSGVVAVCIASVAAGMSWRGDMFGIDIKYDEPGEGLKEWSWFSFGNLTLGTLCYWTWRLIGRLAIAPERDGPSANMPAMGALFVLRQGRSGWSSLGHGIGRAMRLLVVWPALALVSFLIFTPWIEAWLRLPAIPRIPRVLSSPAERDAYADLISFPDRLDWSAAPNRRFTVLGAAEFFEANHARVDELAEILARSIDPPVRYEPLSVSMEQRDQLSLLQTLSALQTLEVQATRTLDVTTEFKLARCALHLARPFRRGGLVTHSVSGRFIELEGFAMACRARTKLNCDQCDELIAIVQKSAMLEEYWRVVDNRNVEWQLVVRGWREQLERSCYPYAFTGNRSLGGFEKEHETYRRTLLCDLALRKYEYEHGLRSPEKLADLVPQYLTAVPLDPFSGKDLLYDRTLAQLSLAYSCSVGQNGKSDGGSPQAMLRDTDDLSTARYAFDWLKEAAENTAKFLPDVPAAHEPEMCITPDGPAPDEVQENDPGVDQLGPSACDD
ncbi:MAG: hypothetical protein AB7O59_21935 [Pirellulales bacterium]